MSQSFVSFFISCKRIMGNADLSWKILVFLSFQPVQETSMGKETINLQLYLTEMSYTSENNLTVKEIRCFPSALNSRSRMDFFILRKKFVLSTFIYLNIGSQYDLVKQRHFELSTSIILLPTTELVFSTKSEIKLSKKSLKFKKKPVQTQPVVGSFADSNIRADVLHSLRCQPKPGSNSSSPLKLSVSLMGHTKAVNCVDWSPSHVDPEVGKEITVFKEDQPVEVIKFSPSNSNLFLSGGSKGSLRLWDIRTGLTTKEFNRSLGTILDLDFSADGKQFISSTDTTRSNVSENTIIVWDILREVPLSNQVYTEAFTCPCVRYHPYEASFVAQSNGNYIAIFSARPPFKLNRRCSSGEAIAGKVPLSLYSAP
ncbi:unnamed protein product [Triticum turgidum subsp. durum]|uniref:WD repeat-containing protein 25 n=1 Tax=Triticum turgidum subsp. durum TaxID=4567 RepID=A0A9R1R222_TRITD|nr:unnamed protein product [Triticum turgidum subsp. durum]